MRLGLRPPTLATYLGWTALRWILGLFAIAALLIFLFDGLEMVRRTSDNENFSVLTVLAITVLRLPSLAEQVLPFAVLFGAIGALMGLSRRLELVVTRAAGVSVWQFMAPVALVSLVLGALATGAYNPLATWAKSRSDEIAAKSFGSAQSLLTQTSRDVWFRQSSGSGDTIIHAETAVNTGLQLYKVTVFAFDEAMAFKNRIEASEASYADGVWTLRSATVYTSDNPPRTEISIEITTELSASQIRQTIAQADSISFWGLPAIIEIARRTGQPANRFALQFQSLLAKPMLLFAMVLIAATVSLSYSRTGQVRQLIVGGVLAGFLLYVIAEVTEDFGAAGLVPPAIAAWSAPIFATLMGVTVLLYTEDG